MSMTLETSHGGQQGKGFKEVSTGSKQNVTLFPCSTPLLSIPLFA